MSESVEIRSFRSKKTALDLLKVLARQYFNGSVLGKQFLSVELTVCEFTGRKYHTLCLNTKALETSDAFRYYDVRPLSDEMSGWIRGYLFATKAKKGKKS